MIRIGKSFLFLLISLLALPAWAGVLTGELDKNEGSLEDQFVYTLTVQGSFDDDPVFPDVPGLEVHGAGKSQNISIINGKYSREVQLQFIINPTKEGTYNIPPIHAKVDGKDMQTLPLEFKVTKGGGASAAGGPAGANDAAIFIEREFSKTSAYVGEAIGVKIKVYNRVKVVGAEPDFKYPAGFQVKSIEGQKNYTAMHGGNEYNVTEIDAILIPNQPGEFKVEPALLNARIAVSRRQRSRSFFDDLMGQTELQEKRLRSEEATLKILPLPLEGRRKDFSGLIGDFTVSADLDPRGVNAGDTMNLSLTVQGRGLAAGMSEPALPFGPNVAKVYKDKPDYHEELDGAKGVTSQRTFKYAVVPNNPGKKNLGKVVIQTFSPSKGRYEDLTADLGEVDVGGTATPAPVAAAPTSDTKGQETAVAPAAPKPEQRSVETIAKDLVEPHLGARLEGRDDISPAEWALSGLALVVGFGGVGGAVYRSRGQSDDERKLRLAKASKAYKLARKQLEAANQCIARQEVAKALPMAQSCLKEYVGAKFGVTGAAITLKDIEGLLRSRDVNRDTLQDLREAWSGLDQMIYAPPLGMNPTRGEELLVKTRKVLEQMERQC